MTIRTPHAVTIGVLALHASAALASSDERLRCAPPVTAEMNVYRPPCASLGHEAVPLLPPTCSPYAWPFGKLCLLDGRADRLLGGHPFRRRGLP